MAACGFPSPILTDEPVTTNEAGPEGGPSVDGGGGGDSSTELPDVVVVDGADPDADISRDAGQKTDAAGCPVNVCDCDKDTFNDLSKPGCADAGGLNDCDDSDTRIRPNQSYLEIPSEAPRNGDWNCMNNVEKYYSTKVSCGLLAVGACAGVHGFSGDPACGEEGEYVFCEATLVLCGVGSKTTRKQACK